MNEYLQKVLVRSIVRSFVLVRLINSTRYTYDRAIELDGRCGVAWQQGGQYLLPNCMLISDRRLELLLMVRLDQASKAKQRERGERKRTSASKLENNYIHIPIDCADCAELTRIVSLLLVPRNRSCSCMATRRKEILAADCLAGWIEWMDGWLAWKTYWISRRNQLRFL